MPYHVKNCPLSPNQVATIFGTMLQDYLGTYTYSNGTTRKAVSIGKANIEQRVTGIELIINPAPESQGHEQSWTFFLVGRDDYSPASMAALAEKLKSAATRGHSVIFQPETDKYDNFPQLICTFPQGFIMLYRMIFNVSPTL
jgi:hypothetical protein